MIGGSAAAHAFSAAHGLAAALAGLAAFFVVGLTLAPRRWHESLGRGERPNGEPVTPAGQPGSGDPGARPH